MLKHDALLIELGTEELPPKALPALSNSFVQGICDGLKEAEIDFGECHPFATPRRLAVTIEQVGLGQPDRMVERKGPPVKAAYDAQGNPTRALLGFCSSNAITPDQLERVETPKGDWLMLRKMVLGKNLEELLPGIIEQALNALPIPRRMRWGAGEDSFVRPVHWLVVMWGEQVIPCNILGKASDNLTFGHRFHHPEPIQIPHPRDYADRLLEPGWVIADFQHRRDRIEQMTRETALAAQGQAVIDEDLLDEVTALNEWPVPILGRFEERFLEVPKECLIEAMQDHQKYFPLVDAAGELMPYFVTIANIESRDPAMVIAGNERVIRPRFSDAAFFWSQDLKTPLESHLDSLAKVVFQKDLGSLKDKTLRVQRLAQRFAAWNGDNEELAGRAALLCKCDLMTSMVYEFTSLQGIMGRYYAQRGGEHAEVAQALDEVYMPRFAGDRLPSSATGRLLALADRVDTLMGIFAAGLKPTGEKDPFGLRRASLGVLRILIETPLNFDLRAMLGTAFEGLPRGLGHPDQVNEVFHYMLDRLRAYYSDRGIRPDVIDAVMSIEPSQPMDFDRRVVGITSFMAHPEAASLAAANKRISNLLRKAEERGHATVETSLLQDPAEVLLFDALENVTAEVEPLLQQDDYAAALQTLAALRDPVDRFFDKVMVLTDDASLRNNRLSLLNAFSSLFLRVADISRLQLESAQ